MIEVHDFNARDRIANAFLENRAFGKTEEVRDIAAGLPFGDGVREDPVLQAAVRNLIYECAKISRGLAMMVETVRSEGVRPLSSPVFAALDADVKLAVSWEKFNELKEILKTVRVPKQTVEEIRRVVFPEQERLPYEHEAPFQCLLDCAAARSTGNADNVLLLAVLELCREHLGDAAAACERWEQDLAANRGLGLSTVRAEAQRKFNAARAEAVGLVTSPDGPVLLVSISPASVPADPPAFLVESWLHEGKRFEPILIDEEHADGARTLSQERLEAAVGDTLCNALDEIRGNATDLRIEIILPFNLLTAAVDEWQFTSGLDKRPLVERYPVVLRSWNRLHEPTFADSRVAWKDKWSQLTREAGNAAGRLWGCEPPPLQGKELRDKLESSKTLVYLNVEPEKDFDLSVFSEQVLGRVLGAGVPIALWLRGHRGDPTTTRDRLAADLWSCSYARWPQRIKELREKRQLDPAAATCDCVGYALLWDNAGLLPPKKPDLRKSRRLASPL